MVALWTDVVDFLNASAAVYFARDCYYLLGAVSFRSYLQKDSHWQWSNPWRSRHIVGADDDVRLDILYRLS